MRKSALVPIILLFCSAFVFGQVTTEQAPAPTPSPTPTRDVPPDFKSDNCSFFPDGNYKDCCVAHDLDYYHGGSCKERSESDKRLYRCVKNKKGWYNKFVAPIMWVGVRIGGVSFLPTPFRWGFGKKKKKIHENDSSPADETKKMTKSKSDEPVKDDGTAERGEQEPANSASEGSKTVTEAAKVVVDLDSVKSIHEAGHLEIKEVSDPDQK